MRRGWLLLIASVCLLVWAVVDAGAQSAAVPTSPPDSGQGQAIYAERCAICHGDTGQGDGAQADAAVNPPAPIGSSDYLRTAVPAEMFAVIKSGRVEAGMPPFGPGNSTPLSDEEIWSLVAAAYSFGTDTETVTVGQANYETTCASCHGEDGRTLPNSDLTNLSYWNTLSNLAVAERIAAAESHTFALTEDEQWPLIDYARTFSYRFIDETARFAPVPEVFVSGQVNNGTTGELAAEGLIATISIFNQFTIQQEYTTTVDATGRYTATLTNIQPDWALVSSVEYQGVNYTSGVAQASQTETELDLPVDIFDTTTDKAVVAIEQIHVIVAFVNDNVEIAELYSFSNNSLTVFVGEDGGPGGTIELGLPAGSQDIIWERGIGGGQSFLPAPEIIQAGDGWVDTVPVRPGRNSHVLLVRYRLPYDGAINLAHPISYDAGRLSLAMPDVGVVVVEDGLWQGRGSQQVAGQQVLNYAGAGLAAGSPLRLSLEGRPTQILDNAGNPILVRNESQEILFGGLALILTIVGGGLLIRRWQDAPAYTAQPDLEGLLEAVADLDDAFEAGEIPAGRYRRQRERLKAELRDLWP